MSELLTENRRLQTEIEKLINENMNLASVIRTLRQHLREDNAKLEDAYRKLDCVAIEGCKSAEEVRG